MNHELYGNVSGIGGNEQKELERLYRRKIESNQVSTQTFNREICSWSRQLGKRISVLTDRTGTVQFVIIGDERLIFLPDLKNYRVSPTELRGLRLIQTSLKGEPITRQDLADLALLRLDLDPSESCSGRRGFSRQELSCSPQAE